MLHTSFICPRLEYCDVIYHKPAIFITKIILKELSLIKPILPTKLFNIFIYLILWILPLLRPKPLLGHGYHTRTHARMHARTRTHMHAHTCTRTYTYTCMYTRTHARHARTHARTRVRAHTHTHTHTHTQPSTQTLTWQHDIKSQGTGEQG